MNFRRKSKNLNTSTNSTASSTSTHSTLCTSNTVTVPTVILSLFLWVTSPAWSQCTVFDLPDSTQNKIVKAHTDLKACIAASELTAKRIIDLKLSNDTLNKSLLVSQKKARRRLKWIYISTGAGLLGGIYLGTRIN